MRLPTSESAWGTGMAREVTADIVRPDELTNAEVSGWMAMIASDRCYASPFFHPAFARAVAPVAPGAAVAVLHRRGEIIGYFPFQRRGSTILPVGAPLNDYHGVIAHAEDRLRLETLPGLIGATSLTVTGWVGGPAGGVSTEQLSILADLSDGWDAYDAERRRTWRHFFNDKDRARRSMVRDHGPLSLRMERSTTPDLDRLIALKQQQYRRSGRHDIFACGWTVDLLKTLMGDGAPGFGAVMAVLEADGRPVAFEYGLLAGDHYHFWFPAYEALVARFSPGILLTLDTMRTGAAEGYSTFDFGCGDEPYKKYFCNRSEALFQGVAGRPGLRSALRSAVISTRLGQSVHRRWKTIDGCETSFAGRLSGLAAAAGSMLDKTIKTPSPGLRPAPASGDAT